MDKIRQWTLAVSAISILSGILTSILPDNGYKKYFKVVSGIILIYAIIQPLSGSNGFDFKIDDFLKDNYMVSEEIDKYAVSSMINSAERAIEDLFYDKAEENNINCEFKCTCFLYNNQISVKNIKVISDISEYDKSLIEDWIISFGFDKSILFFAGEDDE